MASSVVISVSTLVLLVLLVPAVFIWISSVLQVLVVVIHDTITSNNKIIIAKTMKRTRILVIIIGKNTVI